ncbi:DUF5655 domain-containing protein [Gephyromycinifex aptenodytis]|uniref:DUF5655 domain-containing protein n=1 Tax=Gephyromycinifex aptenodytis TaxID=2716227 RepID=UPI001446F95E|nr:DUF5655 domain-containing protein [Gephyromycinifex aptenodytis]
MDEAARDVELATDKLYADAEEHLRPLHDAIIELAHALTDDDDITTVPGQAAIVLARDGAPFAALRPGAERKLEVGLRYPCGPPALPENVVVSSSDGFAATTHRLHLPTDAMDDDIRDIVPWLAAAYDQA